jgi:two-component system, OmpR family, sensor histidine kinase BaeS
MRLRLVHTLSLLLISAVLIAVLAMGALTAWNLQNGFADYLQARDAERLEKFAALVAEAAEQAGGIEALRQRSPNLRELLDQFAQAQGLPGRRSAGGGEGRTKAAGGAPARRAAPGGSDGFGPRVTVVRVDGSQIFDRLMPISPEGFIDRQIRVRGELVALARLRKTGQVPDAVEARFLRKQYIGIFAVSGVLVLLALASAWWVARRWVRPLQAAQDATACIASGDFDMRVYDEATNVERTDEIGDLLRNINQMAEGLQRLESSRRRWLADISHELRTPLAGLRGDIEALVDGVRPLEHKAVVSLREKAIQLGALVDDLHLLAMSDLQALPCEFREIDAVALVRQAVQRFEGRATAKGFVLDISSQGLDVLAVCWDKKRIDQLLDNLLENSFRYTDAPGRISAELEIENHNILIVIEDSSPAVPAEDIPHLFEPLYRADAARSRDRGGSGLGLAICNAIVRSHGGRIAAKLSSLGGLRICIELPLSAESSV